MLIMLELLAVGCGLVVVSLGIIELMLIVDNHWHANHPEESRYLTRQHLDYEARLAKHRG